MAEESVFGLEKEDAAPDLDAIFADEPEAQEAPVAEEPTPEPVAEAEVEVEEAPDVTDSEEASDAEEPPQEEDSPTEQEILYAGRFKDIAQLEEAYKQAQGWGTKASQERARYEKELSDLRQNLEQVRPLLERAAALEQENPEYDDSDPNRLREQLRAEMRQEFQQQQTAAQQRADYESAQAAITQFRTAHPDTEGTDIPNVMRGIFEEYQSEDPDFGPTTLDNLETVYTLASDPRVKGMLDALELFPEPEYVEFAQELVATPELVPIVQAHINNIDNPGFKEWVRTQVRPSTQTPDPQKQKQAAEQRRANAHVVKGGSGAPADAAPGTRPADLSWLYDSPEQRKVTDENQETSILFQ